MELKVTSLDDINYNICSYLLRERINSVTIHSLHEDLLVDLQLYMVEIGYPLSDNQNIYVNFSKSIIEKSNDTFNIYIIFKDEKQENYKDKSLVLEIIDIEKEKIKEIINSPIQFDLENAPLHIKNEEIRKMFLHTFLLAENEIDIISPWMNFGVVNPAFIDLMEQSIQRGVSIKIVYGLLPSADEFNQLRSKRSDKVAQKLIDRLGKYGDRFQISRDNIHYKLVLCDEKFKLEGGYNYLSFQGDYSNPDTRKEGSPIGRNVEEIRLLRKEYFSNGSV